MMLFEEFFKKKKINLVALQQGDHGLFSEFKDHYEQMGEKSFDHTKKFWFNKLRRQFPLPPEVKAEKMRPENPIAEQTMADTLTEPSARDEAPDLDKSKLIEEKELVTPAPKLGFKPKFKSASAVPPTVKETMKENALEDQNASTSETLATPAPKVGFKPRFKAGVTNTKATDEILQSTVKTPQEAKPEDLSNQVSTSEPATTAKLGFKPRFKAGVTSTKPAEEVVKAQEQETIKEETVAPEKKQTEEEPTPKPAYKPRFTPNMIKRKPPEEEGEL